MKIGQPVAIVAGEFAGSHGTVASIEYSIILSGENGVRVKVPAEAVTTLKETIFVTTLDSGDAKGTHLMYVFNDKQEIICASVYTENIMKSLTMQFPYADHKFVGHYTDSILMFKNVRETIAAFKKAQASV